mgnify:CR=1 FL=1
MSIHLSGSLAYDRIMTFPGRFEEHILPEKLHILNVCFLIDRIEEKRGGTAGNIAFNLALLKERPRICASVGKDFEEYARALEGMGLPLDGIRRLAQNFTACAYITTDQQGNQITGFSPAAMNTPCDPAFRPDVKPGDWAVVAPGNVDDMLDLPELYRSHGIPYIYDPGQQVPALGAERLVSGFTGAEALIGNDYEIELMQDDRTFQDSPSRPRRMADHHPWRERFHAHEEGLGHSPAHRGCQGPRCGRSHRSGRRLPRGPDQGTAQRSGHGNLRRARGGMFQLLHRKIRHAGARLYQGNLFQAL